MVVALDDASDQDERRKKQMRVRGTRTALGVLAVLVVLSCSNGGNILPAVRSDLNSGSCAGCLLSVEDSLFSFVVRTEADYELLRADCFVERIRREWLPPRPEPEENLVYVSLRGGGCEGCLDIVNVRENLRNIVVEVEGGFQGECEMLIVPGAWVLIPATKKPVTFEFRSVICSDNE
jgi:hypothetical protein